MSKVPSLSYTEIVRTLQWDGWVIVRQRGSHIRLQKRIGDDLCKITVPAHRPVLKMLDQPHPAPAIILQSAPGTLQRLGR